MDVVMLVQAGVTNVVASSGTAFTAEHVALLKRYTNTLHFAFDGDAAGVQAAEAATREAGAAGLRVATVLFPGGQDPADVAQENPDQLRAYLAAPRSLVAVLLKRLQETPVGSDREAALGRIMPLVQQTTNMVQQGEMVQEIATTLHVSEEAVLERVAQESAPRRSFQPEDEAVFDAATPVVVLPDQLLLGLIIAEPAVRQFVMERGVEDFFSTDQSLALWRALLTQQSRAGFGELSADHVIAALPDDLKAFAEALRRVCEEHVARLSTPPLAEAGALLRSLKLQRASYKLRRLRDHLAEVSGDERALALQEFQTVLKELSSAAP